MREHDEMIARMVEADGVRMASGHHPRNSPHPRHHTDHENIPDGWDQCPDCGGSWDASIINGCRFCRIYGKPADPWIDRRDNDR